jgi:hypothetical protein
MNFCLKNENLKSVMVKLSLHLFFRGFSLAHRTLYNLPSKLLSFYPVCKLFRNDKLSFEDFNNDLFGRLFEAVYEYGSVAFFIRTVRHLYKQCSVIISSDTLHPDITNFSVRGEYNSHRNDDTIRVTRGKA